MLPCEFYTELACPHDTFISVELLAKLRSSCDFAGGRLMTVVPRRSREGCIRCTCWRLVVVSLLYCFTDFCSSVRRCFLWRAPLLLWLWCCSLYVRLLLWIGSWFAMFSQSHSQSSVGLSYVGLLTVRSCYFTYRSTHGGFVLGVLSRYRPRVLCL